MAKLAIKKASTDVTVYLFIQDSSVTTGAGKTGLAYNTSSLVAYYVRPLGSATQLTLATQTVTGAHSDGGFVEVDATNMPGLYRLDLSDAICATGVNSVVVMLKGAANMAPVVLEIQLTSYDPNDAVRLGMTALPNAAADAAGGLPISDAGALDLDALNTNVSSILADTGTDGVIVASIKTDVITADAIKTDAVAEIADGVLDEAMAGHVGAGTLGKAIADTLEDTGTTIPADLVDIENKIDVIGVDTTTEIPASITALDGKIDTIDNFLDTEVAAILADTNELQTDLVNGGRLDLLIDGIKAKTDNIPASPAAVGSAMTLANGAITAAVIATDAIDADAIKADAITEIQAGLATAAALNTVDNFLDTEVAAILADTNELQTDWANGGRLDLILDAAGAAGDPWITALPGTYAAGSAGKLLSDISNIMTGTGALTWTYTVTDGTNPVQGCNVWVSTDAAGTNIVGSQITNSSGVVTFKLDAGTVYVWRYKLGFDATNPDIEVVS